MPTLKRSKSAEHIFRRSETRIHSGRVVSPTSTGAGSCACLRTSTRNFLTFTPNIQANGKWRPLLRCLLKHSDKGFGGSRDGNRRNGYCRGYRRTCNRRDRCHQHLKARLFTHTYVSLPCHLRVVLSYSFSDWIALRTGEPGFRYRDVADRGRINFCRILFE